MANYKQGFFKPLHPEKYKGDPTNIIYRSGWELTFMSYLDRHKDVLQWSSEEFCIPYLSPLDGKYHRYFPDFWVKKQNPEGKISIIVVEIKPHGQTIEPKPSNKMTKRYLKEVHTWGINSSKWRYAIDFCKQRNWEFMILTEKHLGL